MRPFYYVRTIEKILIGIIDMFNNMYVNKYNDMSRTTYDRSVQIPIITHNNANFTNFWSSTQYKQLTVPLPLGSVRFVSNAMDSTNRPQPTYAREIFSRSNDKWIRDIQPTPYTFNFELGFIADNLSDIFQIKENIEPYFNEYRTITIKEWDFAPEIPRPIVIHLSSNSVEFQEEVNDGDAQMQLYKVTYSLTAYGVYHRPYERPEMIKYAEMNFHIDEDIIHKNQLLVYPNEIIQQKKRLWETICPTTRDGYSILHSLATTLVKRTDDNGNPYYEDQTLTQLILHDKYTTYGNCPDGEESSFGKDGQSIYEEVPVLDENGNQKLDENGKPIFKLQRKKYEGADGQLYDMQGLPVCTYEEAVVSDIARPAEVPSFDLLRFDFDRDMDLEYDQSGFGRDFIAVNPAKQGDPDGREFIQNLPPGNGQEVTGGYAVDENVDWSKILNWFGDNPEGTIESSYTFKATLQFVEDVPGDTIFQYLSNEETTLSDGTVIPEGEVWFDWGMMNNHLYFTYHTSSKMKTFVSEPIEPNKTTIYSFYFALYNNGDNGIFGVKTNFSETMMVLNTSEALD